MEAEREVGLSQKGQKEGYWLRAKGFICSTKYMLCALIMVTCIGK